MKFSFIPIDYDYDAKDDKILIYGRTDKGEQVCVVDGAENYFYNPSPVKSQAVKKTEKTKKNYLGKPVELYRIFARKQDIPSLAGKKSLETDINPITRYITDKKIIPLQWYSVEGERITPEKARTEVIKAEKISKTQEKAFSPKTLAFDIEAEKFGIGEGKILYVSLYGSVKKVITWKKFSTKHKEIEFVKDEAELLQRFCEIIEKESPDFLVGYFSDGFDMPYLRARAEKNNVEINLGLDNSGIKFIRGRLPSARLTGIVHVDLFKFINNILSPTLKSEVLNLNEVAKELIGEEKLKFDASKILDGEETEEELEKFALYNLQDSYLAYNLFQKLYVNISEISKIVAQPIFKTSRAAYSQLVENYILHNLPKYNEIAKSKPSHDEISKRRMRKKYQGAFVLQPKPGLYENIAFFDFTSFYSSIITSFNISLSTLGKKGYNIEAEGKKISFGKKPGFMPLMLKEIIKKRKELKQEMKRNPSPILNARNYAFKTIANATYGYNGFFAARYYCLECASAITAFARKYIHETIAETEKNNFSVIYADTDGYALCLNKKTKQQTTDFLKKLNNKLPGDLELDLEGFYKRGIFVTKRTREAGAKKKYALLGEDNKMKIRGFETVRRDWCDLAREVQDNVLKKILQEGSAKSSLTYVKKIISDIRSRKISNEKLIIKTQLKKDIGSYLAEGPHVAIAKRMMEKGIPVDAGELIEYIVSKGSGKRVRDRAKLPNECKKGEYDTDYYIKNQISAAVGNIFEVFSISDKELINGQKRLF